MKDRLGYSWVAEYNAHVNRVSAGRNVPNLERLSVLAATIMLAYALNRFMEIPARTFELQLPGIFISTELNDNILTALLVAALTAAGVDWLFRDHPTQSGKRILPHLLLPATTALMIGIPLNQLSAGVLWWVGLLFGTVVLVAVILAEYVVLDEQDTRYPLAAAGLSAVAFTIYLILASALRAAGTRLFFMLPTVLLATWLVSLRSLNLRLHGEWVVYEAAIVAFLVGQLAAATHYWPLAPVRFGLILLGPAYALTGLFTGLIEVRRRRELLLEPILVLGISWIGALILS